MKSQNSASPRTRSNATWWKVGLLGAALAFGTNQAQAQITVPGTHASLAAAFADINNGVVTGAVTIDITASYTEPVGSAVLNSSGAGAANYTSVTIRPSADGVVITGTTATGRGIIELNGADNVTIEGDNPNTGGTNRNLTILNNATNLIAATSCIRLAVSTLILTADNNTIQNCIIRGSGTGRNTSSFTTEVVTWGIIAAGGASTTTATTAPSALTTTGATMTGSMTAANLRIQNNEVQTVSRGIAVNGAVLTAAPTLNIIGNLIGNATPGAVDQVYTYAISVQGSSNAVIAQNTTRTESFQNSSTNNPRGIDIGTLSANTAGVLIERNSIERSVNNNTASWPAHGINLNGGNNHILQNNFVKGISSSQVAGTGAFSTTFGSFGIKITLGTGHKVIHNTVDISGVIPGSTSTMLVSCLAILTNGQTGCDVRNNIFSNQLTGGNLAANSYACVWLNTGLTSAFNLTENNNAYYQGSTSASGIAQTGATFGTGFYTAANFNPAATSPATNWRSYTSTLNASGTNDNASFGTAAAPPLVSTSDLHVAGTPAALNNTGASLGVVFDIDGQYRSTPPDIGADEFTPNPCGTPAASVNHVQDCLNGQFYLDVTITALSGSSSVDVGSDYPGNPGADAGVGLGTHQIGPFPSNTNVQVLLTSNTSALCNTSLGTFSFDCSTNGQNALSFDGVNDRVDVPASASLSITGTAFTVEAWIYPTAFSTAGEHGNSIVNKEGPGGAGFMLRCGNNGQIGFSVGVGTFPVATAPVGTLVLNQWQHVAGVYDGVNMRIYKNGVLVGTPLAQTNAMVASAAVNMAIGNWIQGNDRPFAGKIDEVRIWGVARTAPQLNTTMNNVLCGTEPGLRAYYQLNQGTAGGNNAGITNAPDLTANANNGTAVNMALTGPNSNWVVGKTGLGACLACTQATATAAAAQDCANNQFFINVNVSNLNGGPGVNVVSNYSGNPGAQFGVGTGTYQLGPFTTGSNVLVTVQHTGDPACNLSLGTFTYDCSTFGQNALSFDGVNDRVNCGTAASLNITGNALTLEAWIYPTAWRTSSFEGSIINKEAAATAGYMLRCGNNGQLSFNFGTGTAWVEIVSAQNALTLNTWQHVAGTFDGTTLRFYRDGVQLTPATTTGTPAPIGPAAAIPLQIGHWSQSDTRGFIGKIDEPRVWNVVRSAGDLTGFLNQQLCGNEPGLVAYYHFDQGIADENNTAVTTAIDASPNGNTGTLTGFTLNGTTSNWVLGKTGMGVCVACSGPPTAGSITGNGSACNAASNLLTLSGATFGLGITYQWKYGPVGGPYTNLLGTAPTQNTSGIPVGTYDVVVDVTCSTGPDMVTTAAFPLTIKAVPTASASAGPGCLGQTLNLTGTTDIGTTFTWSGPNSFGSAAQNPSIAAATAAAAGTYTFTASLNGCSSTPAITSVSMNPSPFITSTTSTPGTVCLGEPSQLNVVASSNLFYQVASIPHAPMSGSGTPITSWTVGGSATNDDSHSSPITLPFTFMFNGTPVNTVWVGTNGYLALTNPSAWTAVENRTSANMNSATAPNGIIAMCFADLIMSAGTASTFTVGLPGNQVFVLDYTNVPFFNGVGSVTGQILLYETTNVVEVHLTSVSHGSSTSANALGIENLAGSARIFPPGRSSAVWNVTTPEAWRFAPPSNTYQWSPAGSLSNATIVNPVATPTGTTPYTVTVSNGVCSAQGTTSVNVVPVDDGDPCTVDGCSGGMATHTYTDTDNDGTCDGLDGCPLDANKIAPGICGCGVADTDTDGDLTADCNDGCPLDPNKVVAGICGCGVADTDTDGDLTADCNDGCPLDPNKIVPGLCGCGNLEGTCNDCEGVDSGPAQPGTPCDDLDACTINDVWSPACACAGTFQDTDSDSVCDADDICPGADDLLDTDNDGVVDCLDNCPFTNGQLGTSCDDGNPNTVDDVVDANCVCAGTVPPCPNNLTILSLTTDNDAAQTTWDVIPVGGGTALCDGTGLANNSTFAYNCCLPNGCYELRVFDSAGDGMANGSIGGYTLSQSTGNKRIIDNSGDGIFTTTSTIASNLGFCVPLGNDALLASNCDKADWLPTDIIQATVNPTVTGQFGVSNATSGYQFWFFNPDGGYSRRLTQTHAAPGNVTGAPANVRASYLRLSAIVSNPIPFYTNLNVRIRTQVAGVFSEFGPACRFRLDPPCTTTELTTSADPVISCGATGLTLSSTIYATAVLGATTYQFEFTKPGYQRRIAQTVRSTGLGFVTNPLQNNNCYRVRVRISFDNAQTYCPFGPYCNVIIGTAICGQAMAPEPGNEGTPELSDNVRMLVWPNPNDGSQVNISLTQVDATVNTVTVDVTDVYGKVVATHTLPVQNGYLNTVLPFEQTLAPGLYLVNVSAGDVTRTERLVIAR